MGRQQGRDVLLLAGLGLAQQGLGREMTALKGTMKCAGGIPQLSWVVQAVCGTTSHEDLLFSFLEGNMPDK